MICLIEIQGHKKKSFFILYKILMYSLQFFLFPPLNQGICMNTVSPSSPPPPLTDDLCKEWQVPNPPEIPLQEIPKIETAAKTFIVADWTQAFILPVLPVAITHLVSKHSFGSPISGLAGGGVYLSMFQVCVIDIFQSLYYQYKEANRIHELNNKAQESNNKEQRKIIKDQVDDHNKIVLNLKLELSKLSDQITLLTSENKTLINSNLELKKNIEEFNIKLQQLTITNTNLIKTEENLKTQVSELTSENENLINVRTGLETTLDDFRNANTHIETTMKALYTLREQHQESLKRQEELQEQNNQINITIMQRIAEDEKHRAQMATEVQELKNVSTSLEDYRLRLINDIDERQKEFEKLKASIEELKTTENGLRNIHNDLQDTH